MRVSPLDETFAVVTFGEGEKKAFIVFRGPEDAQKFREHVGRYTPEEGCKLVTTDHEAIAALLETQGLRYVAMPEPWIGGDGGVDLFEAGNFIRMLEESMRD